MNFTWITPLMPIRGINPRITSASCQLAVKAMIIAEVTVAIF
jgi:hypothetical protein